MQTKRFVCGGQSQKINLWWNEEVKDAIRAKKVTYKAWFHNKPISLHSWHAEAQKSSV